MLVTLRNPHSQRAHPDRRAWVSEPLKVGLRGLQSGWEVVRTGRVERLSPGDSIEVELLVRPSAKGKGRILEELENVEVVAGKVDGQLVKAWTIGRLKGVGTLVRDWDLWENDPVGLVLFSTVLFLFADAAKFETDELGVPRIPKVVQSSKVWKYALPF